MFTNIHTIFIYYQQMIADTQDQILKQLANNPKLDSL